MEIKRLRLKNFRGFSELDCEFRPHINVFAGVNGSGKSSILDALNIMLSHAVARLRREGGQGASIKNEDIAEGCHEATISLTFQDSAFSDNGTDFSYDVVGTRSGHARASKSNFEQLNSWSKSYRQARSTNSPVHYPILAHYRVNRAVIDIPQRIRSPYSDDQLGGYDDALSGHGNFREFFAWFRDQEDYENEERRNRNDRDYCDPMLHAVRSSIEKLLPGFRNIRVRRRPKQALCAEKEGVTFELSQLSDGEKCYLALVGDIACRMARLCGGLGFPSSDILRTSGVVLIDELDLHLHPKWQRQAISRLPLAFPNVQFIVTTHSPQMLGVVLPQCIGLLSPGISKPIVPSHSLGLSSNEILENNMDETSIRDALSTGIEKGLPARTN